MEDRLHFTLRFLHVRQPLFLPPIINNDRDYYERQTFAISVPRWVGKHHHNLCGGIAIASMDCSVEFTFAHSVNVTNAGFH